MKSLGACVFCKENEDPSSSMAFLPQDWPYASRVIYSNANVYVVPGVGPQVYPYSLVVTRRHFTSFADSTKEEREALLDALNALLSFNVYPSGSVCVFEHGGCSGTTTGCLDHCHIHVVDSAFDLENALQHYARSAVPATLSAITSFPKSPRYLFAASFSGGSEIQGTFYSGQPPLRQYFRRLLAMLTGSTEWNWRLGMNADWMIQLTRAVAEQTGEPKPHPFANERTKHIGIP